MQITINESDVDHLIAELPKHGPWMHRFKFNDVAVVGYFKQWRKDITYWVKSQNPTDYAHAAQLENAYVQSNPAYHLDAVLKKLGTTDLTLLDIASATGLYSFHAASKGLSQVKAVEIRPEQVAQANLIKQLATNIPTKNLTIEHDPTSADDPAFRDGEQYDVVLSLGLLYHLANPVQHILNLARLARKAVIVQTLIHRSYRRGWELVLEDDTFMTKAAQGVSWIGHYSEVHKLLRQAGFKHVESLGPPGMEPLADLFTLEPRNQLQTYVDAGLRKIGIKPSMESVIKANPDVPHSLYYYSYIVYKD
jgi:2-polyprenyl-3-methyl-5-hydroxy-6-metoxy-1,4-benzoquinol methylase